VPCRWRHLADAAIKSFTAPGDVFACVESPLGDGVTTFTSEAIEPAVVERVEYAWIESLAAHHIEWQRAMTTAFAFLARAKIRRERDLLMLTAEQLYGSFVESEPTLAARIPPIPITPICCPNV
jgi:hypothetical protein